MLFKETTNFAALYREIERRANQAIEEVEEQKRKEQLSAWLKLSAEAGAKAAQLANEGRTTEAQKVLSELNAKKPRTKVGRPRTRGVPSTDVMRLVYDELARVGYEKISPKQRDALLDKTIEALTALRV